MYGQCRGKIDGGKTAGMYWNPFQKLRVTEQGQVARRGTKWKLQGEEREHGGAGRKDQREASREMRCAARAISGRRRGLARGR
jgi:hypothetical protein